MFCTPDFLAAAESAALAVGAAAAPAAGGKACCRWLCSAENGSLRYAGSEDTAWIRFSSCAACAFMARAALRGADSCAAAPAAGSVEDSAASSSSTLSRPVLFSATSGLPRWSSKACFFSCRARRRSLAPFGLASAFWGASAVLAANTGHCDQKRHKHRQLTDLA